LVAACDGSGNSNNVVAAPPVEHAGLTGCADSNSCASNPVLQIGGARPAPVRIPSDYTTTSRYPLIIVLHGLGVDGTIQAAYLGLDVRVDSKQYVLVMPDGTESRDGTRFWNATPACCAYTDEDKEVDDVAYIRSLIKEAAATYSIDTRRIGLIGHSNGAFMALRMVCEASELVTSVVSLAGSTFADDASCAPASTPVSVLTMHGDADDRVFYQGGEIAGNPYPSEPETTRRFAAHAHCDTEHPVFAANIDVVNSVDGAETTVLQYTDCALGVDVTLWTMQGVSHIPIGWVGSAIDRMIDWVPNHPRS
jgi:polyhydroxybutyrate depolymerase